ncbi:MAG: hypothetical protein DBW74_01140 [Cryomorphaceae bacterium]|nr:MAG: hypothetical protein DBW74_01140 [Cryomorphaceae bacterium]|tara:strand:+ start:795 stop:983 length:189 start_codon:yes stop_codon:yes gene_type:complete
MKISSAFIKIGDKKYNLKMSDKLDHTSININIESGKTTMEPGFILENGQASVAFYTDIDFLF